MAQEAPAHLELDHWPGKGVSSGPGLSQTLPERVAMGVGSSGLLSGSGPHLGQPHGGMWPCLLTVLLITRGELPASAG